MSGVIFDITVTERAGWRVIAVLGELDLSTAPRLRQHIVTAINEGATRLVLDLSGTDFLDSIGLGVIVGALKRLQPLHGQLVVATDVARIRSVFELTRLDQIVPVVADVDTAISLPPEVPHG